MLHFSILFALTVNIALSAAVGADQPLEERRIFDQTFLEMPQFIEDDRNEVTDLCTCMALLTLIYQRMESCPAHPNESEEHLLLSQIESIKSDGIPEEEFKKIKQRLIDFICSLPTDPVSKALFNPVRLNLESINCAEFTSRIAALENRDILRLLIQYPKAPLHKIHAEYPKSDWMFDRATDSMAIRFADNSSDDERFFFIDSSGPIEPFYQLPLDDREQKLIHDLIKAIAEKNVWGLLFKKKEMEKMGKRVNHVHPMRFMGHILSDHKLKKWLREIRHSSFKWDHFIDGFSDRMKEEGARNNLLPYVPGMAHLLQTDPNLLFEFIHNKDYEGLVKSQL